ncbi:MAG TPA: hypothetical protein VM452_07135 [Caulifigura sp.]|jgi:hypothetical protein|nr:hypothetical protein [Caulifigura sp.]
MAAIDVGIDFDRLRRAGAETPRTVGDARWEQILGLMQFASQLVESSPDADRIRAYKERTEREWQQIQKRLFANAQRI